MTSKIYPFTPTKFFKSTKKSAPRWLLDNLLNALVGLVAATRKRGRSIFPRKKRSRFF